MTDEAKTEFVKRDKVLCRMLSNGDMATLGENEKESKRSMIAKYYFHDALLEDRSSNLDMQENVSEESSNDAENSEEDGGPPREEFQKGVQSPGEPTASVSDKIRHAPESEESLCGEQAEGSFHMMQTGEALGSLRVSGKLEKVMDGNHDEAELSPEIENSTPRDFSSSSPKGRHQQLKKNPAPKNDIPEESVVFPPHPASPLEEEREESLPSNGSSKKSLSRNNEASTKTGRTKEDAIEIYI